MWRHEDAWRALGGDTDFATRKPIEELAPSRAAARDRQGRLSPRPGDLRRHQHRKVELSMSYVAVDRPADGVAVLDRC
ncbi:hypothetical protein [Nocardioides sp. NPDC006273]|uniref:hypothetical protein n=1 Tax=Nocardioides sp. NPDC006273 TaxID=3155598 RepID=UPI00339E9662